VSSPAGSVAEPQPKSNLVHISLKSGNDLIYFLENKMTKLANFVQFKRMLMFCLEDLGAWAPCPPLGYATDDTLVQSAGDKRCLVQDGHCQMKCSSSGMQ